MITRIVALVAGLALLAGCGGGLRGSLPPVGAYDTASSAGDDELLAEELSAKRLEELYAKSGIPGWDPSLEEELKRWDHQVKFDVPIQMNKQVRAYLVYFSTERKDIIRRYLARSTRYLPMIKETFQEYGLPEDLAYLALIESGFNPDAYSPAGACGMWQFIKSTGQRYGLVINGYVDERRDPGKSTRAAAQYLLDLYKQFGSWYLAAASYNCGERRVQEELRQSHHQNFWELSAHRRLPDETKNYVPQMIAATIIAKNPERFGFKNVPYQPPLTAEQLAVAEPARNIAATRVSNPGVGSMLAHTGKGNLSPSQPKRQPSCQSSLACQPKKQASVAAVKIDKFKTNPSTNSHSNLRVASLLGVSYTASDQSRAGENKSKRQVTANTKRGKTPRAVAHKGKKKKPALLAMKNENKNARARKKSRSSPHLHNGKLAEARPKAMLVSEAR
jgi:soluble lytic murein transglycosylase-like protein